MAKKKSAASSPDTEPPEGEGAASVDPDVARHNSADNSESIDSNSAEYSFGAPSQPGPRIHPAIFVVMKDGNILRFLSNLIVHLQVVDKTSALLPTPEATTAEPFSRTAQIPKEVKKRMISSRSTLLVLQ